MTGAAPSPTAFTPISRGYELDPNFFGYLRDSSHCVDNADELHERIEEDGYLFIRDLLPRGKVLDVRKVITDRLKTQGFLDGNHASEDGIIADIKIMNARSAFRPVIKEGEKVTVKTFVPEDLTRDNQPLRDLMFQSEIIPFMETFFGSPVLHYNHIWFRAVGPGMGTPPHCDWVYMSRGTPKLLTAWVPIGDAPLDVGGLMILEKSHQQAPRLKNYLSRDVDDYCLSSPRAKDLEQGKLLFEWDGTLSKNPVAVREKLGGRWLTADFQAGDVLLFTMRTVHASLDNQSLANRIRISVDTRYQRADEPVDERWMAPNSAPYAREFKRGRIC